MHDRPVEASGAKDSSSKERELLPQFQFGKSQGSSLTGLMLVICSLLDNLVSNILSGSHIHRMGKYTCYPVKPWAMRSSVRIRLLGPLLV